MFIRKVLAHYPHQALWQLLAVVRSNLPARAKRCSQILTKAETDPNVQKICDLRSIRDQVVLLTECMLKLCNSMPHKTIKTLSIRKDFSDLINLGNSCQLIIPIQSSLIPSFMSFNQHDILYPLEKTSMGARFLDEILVMSSLQRPKKITILGSDGKYYPFLCKPKDDLRKDSRLMEFNALINQALVDDPESCQRALSIKTYAVVPLNEECGLIQWVPNTISMQHVTLSMYRESNNPISMSSLAALLNTKSKNPGQFFVENVLKKYPPVLYKWFMKKFNSPEEWYASRINFACSAAVMSIIGYVIGLGDRHCENILLNEKTGQVVHVDFNCLFEKGLTLEVPELVPFRLTHNMEDAMGPTKFEGKFRKSCEITMRLLRMHREALMSILDSFVHDPLVEWSTHKPKRGTISSTVNSKDLAGVALLAIRYKLAGVFNNAHLSVTGHVDELIKEATNPAKLCKMYIGWAPFL
ncbi:hypothetical protein BB561_002143 [Smittium simulii]|uniref:non-specific serine/threonine protein kinase n=1 Tax=Smittium simulii TaxID=133385 RepID=A0A2T9YRL8_9FUNG|nr:hypothetical protein BB561_002143 [Smittium simulii]